MKEWRKLAKMKIKNETKEKITHLHLWKAKTEWSSKSQGLKRNKEIKRKKLTKLKTNNETKEKVKRSSPMSVKKPSIERNCKN